MVFFDLKSGYHHVDIHVGHWKYLGICLEQWSGEVLLLGGETTHCWQIPKVGNDCTRQSCVGKQTLEHKTITVLTSGLCSNDAGG